MKGFQLTFQNPPKSDFVYFLCPLIFSFWGKVAPILETLDSNVSTNKGKGNYHLIILSSPFLSFLYSFDSFPSLLLSTLKHTLNKQWSYIKPCRLFMTSKKVQEIISQMCNDIA